MRRIVGVLRASCSSASRSLPKGAELFVVASAARSVSRMSGSSRSVLMSPAVPHLRAAAASCDEARSLLLRAGEFVMLVRDRNTPLVAADHLETLIDAMSDDELISSLDLEISFGWGVDSGSWRVDLSTLPWREGQLIAFRD